MSELRIGSLCTGYGGLDHAVQNVLGGKVAWVSDIDRGACKIIAHRYPDVPNIGDMTKVDWAELAPIDILTAGYPCQPFSHAGKRKGTNDERHLWPYVREAVRVLRPRLTVLENVAGHRSLGFDRVLGDLAEDGMHVWWTSLRASDVGAAHQRERLFIFVAQDASSIGWEVGVGADESLHGRRPVRPERPSRGGGCGNDAQGDLTLLPTPAVNDMGAAYTPETWDAWTEKMRAEHGNGNGHGKSLAIEAKRLLPTPTSKDSAASGGSTPSDVTLTDAVVRTDLGQKENPRHAVPAEGRPDQVLPSVRRGVEAQEVRERTTRGPKRVSQEDALLAQLCEHEGRYPGQLSPLASAEGEIERVLRGVRGDVETARSPQGPGCDEQRTIESCGPVCELSPEASLARGRTYSFGQYEAAVQRWEQVLGRTAPEPTTLNSKGNPQLSARFTEFLMGLPAGHVTDVPGITRNEALKALGNGVVPQQAEAALRWLLERLAVAA